MQPTPLTTLRKFVRSRASHWLWEAEECERRGASRGEEKAMARLSELEKITVEIDRLEAIETEWQRMQAKEEARVQSNQRRQDALRGRGPCESMEDPARDEHVGAG